MRRSRGFKQLLIRNLIVSLVLMVYAIITCSVAELGHHLHPPMQAAVLGTEDWRFFTK